MINRLRNLYLFIFLDLVNKAHLAAYKIFILTEIPSCKPTSNCKRNLFQQLYIGFNKCAYKARFGAVYPN